MTRILRAAALLVASGCSGPRGEVALSAYGGKAWNSDADLRLKEPGGTDLKLSGVELDAESFERPIYYGLRGTYWLPPAGADEAAARLGTWGLMLEFTHTKANADEDQVVHQQGTRNGAPVSGSFPVRDSIESYELSHGHNLLTLNALHRWLPMGRRGRLQPYVGAGAGLACPRVEALVNGVETDGYQLAGWTVQGLAGVNVDLTRSLGAFVEYKLNWADVDAELGGGGSIQQEIWTHQLLVGLTWRF